MVELQVIYGIISFMLCSITAVVTYALSPKKLIEYKEKIIYTDKEVVLDFPLVGTTVYYILEDNIKEDVISSVTIDIDRHRIKYSIYGITKHPARFKIYSSLLEASKFLTELQLNNGDYEFTIDGVYLLKQVGLELNKDEIFFTREECIEHYNNKLLEEFNKKLK